MKADLAFASPFFIYSVTASFAASNPFDDAGAAYERGATMFRR